MAEDLPDGFGFGFRVVGHVTMSNCSYRTVDGPPKKRHVANPHPIAAVRHICHNLQTMAMAAAWAQQYTYPPRAFWACPHDIVLSLSSSSLLPVLGGDGATAMLETTHSSSLDFKSPHHENRPQHRQWASTDVRVAARDIPDLSLGYAIARL